jgi:phosphoribosylglycinamide formyltransferase-1
MIAVLISGTGRSLANLIDKNFKIVWVGSTKECPGLAIAEKAGIPTVICRETKEFFKFAREKKVELIVLAGFLKMLEIPPDYAGKVINIHPSLLPAFGGKGMFGINVHKAAIESGVKFSGCTVHYVTNQYDQGPIITQRIVAVEEGDTPETLASKVFEQEKIALPDAIVHHKERLKICGNKV